MSSVHWLIMSCVLILSLEPRQSAPRALTKLGIYCKGSSCITARFIVLFFFFFWRWGSLCMSAPSLPNFGMHVASECHDAPSSPTVRDVPYLVLSWLTTNPHSLKGIWLAWLVRCSMLTLTPRAQVLGQARRWKERPSPRVTQGGGSFRRAHRQGWPKNSFSMWDPSMYVCQLHSCESTLFHNHGIVCLHL